METDNYCQKYSEKKLYFEEKCEIDAKLYNFRVFFKYP